MMADRILERCIYITNLSDLRSAFIPSDLLTIKRFTHRFWGSALGLGNGTEPLSSDIQSHKASQVSRLGSILSLISNTVGEITARNRSTKKVDDFATSAEK